jgi:hypothetical protein
MLMTRWVTKNLFDTHRLHTWDFSASYPRRVRTDIVFFGHLVAGFLGGISLERAGRRA